MKKTILHLCADTGSDSKPYQQNDDYEVIKVGAAIGVENFTAPKNVYGIIANPVCTEFSKAKSEPGDHQKGMQLVNECLRIIDEAKHDGNLKFWVIENPATGSLKDYLGKPTYAYEPWWFGSPWTNEPGYGDNSTSHKENTTNGRMSPKIDELYIRPGRKKPGIAFLHKSAVNLIPEFVEAGFTPDSDMEFVRYVHKSLQLHSLKPTDERKTMMDKNGKTPFRKGVEYGERLERARIIAILNDIKMYPTGWNYDNPIESVIALIKGETK